MIKENRSEYLLKFLLVILLIADLVYTYLQNYHFVWLDGDMSAIVIATRAYKHVLEDPFAFSAVFGHETYAATNRFFIHWSMQFYCKNAPSVFQFFLDPVDSVFAAMAFLKTAFHVIMIVLISFFISGSRVMWSKQFLIAACIITPFFQVTGYEEFMGVNFGVVTYMFFYSIPLICILLYFKPFYFKYVLNENIRFHPLRQFWLLFLMLTIAFGGSLGAPVIVIACSLSLLYNFIYCYRNSIGTKGRLKQAILSMEKVLLFQFGTAIVVALYSIYAGTFNSENSWATIPLSERYALLPKGFIRITTYKLGLGLLIVLSILFVFILKFKRKPEYNKYLLFIKWLSIFCLLFILMLPLGGYRVYRPLIIRGDTFTPVTISIFIIYGIAAMLLLREFTGRNKKILIIVYVVIAGIYTNADRWPKNTNESQRYFMNILRNSDQEITELPNWSLLLSWGHYTNHLDSELSAELLQQWGVTKEKKMWFQKPN